MRTLVSRDDVMEEVILELLRRAEDGSQNLKGSAEGRWMQVLNVG